MSDFDFGDETIALGDMNGDGFDEELVSNDPVERWRLRE